MLNKCLRFLLAVVFAAILLLGQSSFALAAEDGWTVYVYMCGSDLESDGGYATANLEALKSVPLPKDVKFVIQTGGAKKWQSKDIPAKELGRYIYDNSGFHEVERLNDASMGDEDTLEDFLRFGKEKFPADKRMLLFWDHGGGSLGGFCLDEKYGTILGLNDLRRALENVETANPTSPPFDLVLFDTCLMANIETANTLYGFSRYLVASEEVMPSTGTDYAGWVGALVNNPAMDGRELGMAICETYIPYCKQHDLDEMAMLSLVDLGKLPALNAAYENFGKEAIREAKRDPQYFFTAYDRIASNVEKYGFNDGDNWTNMIDLGLLAANMNGLSSANAFTKALDDAVICRVAGWYRKYGMGLSGYYGLDGSLKSWQTYAALSGASPVFSGFYRDMLSGNSDGKPWFYFDVSKIAGTPVELDENNVAGVTLSPEAANAVSNADFFLCVYDKNGDLIYIGNDDKIDADWDKGVIKENFDGKWPALNGNFVPLYLYEQQNDYNIYCSTFMLNGKRCCMTAVYDFAKGEFAITGVRRILKNGWWDRQVLQLKPGDKITPLFMNEHDKEVKGETFVLDAEPILQDEPLPDDTYAFAFCFTTARNEKAVSETIHFVIKDGEMTAVK